MERAVAFFWTNKWTVNGCMTGGMTVTGKRRSGVTPQSLTLLPRYSDLLQGVRIDRKDYRDCDLCADTFTYLDSPYEGVGHTLYRDTVDLNEFAAWATNAPASVMITLNDSLLTNRLLAPFDRMVEPVSYAVHSHFGGKGRQATEIVSVNYFRATRAALVRRFGWTVREAVRAAA